MDDNSNDAQNMQREAALQQRIQAQRGLAVEPEQVRFDRLGMVRVLHIAFAGNGYIVNEHMQGAYDTVPSGKPPMIFATAPALVAYVAEVTQGGPGGMVTPVPAEYAGLVPDDGGDLNYDRQTGAEDGPQPTVGG